MFLSQNSIESIITYIKDDSLQKAPLECKEWELSTGIYELTPEEWNSFPTDLTAFDLEWHKRFKQNQKESRWLELDSF